MSNQQQTQDEAIEELRSIIRQGVRTDGIETTLIEIGVSMFQSETLIQELLCRVIGTQRALVDKGILTLAEIDESVSKTFQEHAEALHQTLTKIREQDKPSAE